MDASKMGTKIKVDGKNQKTVLSESEICKIIDTFNKKIDEDGFCVTVSYENIEDKKLSFSAGHSRSKNLRSGRQSTPSQGVDRTGKRTGIPGLFRQHEQAFNKKRGSHE